MSILRRAFPNMSEEEATLLQAELLRRAASGFEQAKHWREAAECWSELGERGHAGELYARVADLEQAGQSWLQAGRYAQALEVYQQWEAQLLDGDVVHRIRALLGQAACHLLGGVSLHGHQASPRLTRASGQQAYQRARELLAAITGRDSFNVARSWEVLGDYGVLLGRYDLVQEGYERALEELASTRVETEQVRIGQAYLAVAQEQGDRLLCRVLEERLATWSGKGEDKPVIRPLPVEQLRLLRTLTGHSELVYSVAISPDGQTLVSGSDDNTIKLWNLHTGEHGRTLTGHTGIVWSLAISPDGQTLVSGCDDNTIKLWNLHTGEHGRTLTGHTGIVYCVAISPDGQTLVSVSQDDTIKLWNLHTGEHGRTLTGHEDRVMDAALSPDGQILVSASWDNTIKVWGT